MDVGSLPICGEDDRLEDMTDRGTEEHHEAEHLLATLMAADPGKGDFTTVLERFEKAVKHHVDEEESDPLPVLGKAIPPDKLMKMGRVFSQAKPPKPKGRTKEELVEQARENIEGYSSMTKDELAAALAD
ncbi:hypothetical protein GT755_29895 [Herbidospora sp. NEAU-GS84]|uniref:Hemerythrin-like domain-containing protein n=1 Tax=Herbidospora solisilvae TaxID=2696284 RepID=A0A7C9J6C3_9ACTN|nr:hemerythrin domain-containing protein [Herbidospora solisilvae]NAS25882.1 hypothetical protein [Herbidospora solisilvae]